MFKGRIVMVATIVAVMAMLSQLTLAFAGSNGQQVVTYNPWSDPSWTCLYGQNQYGDYVERCVPVAYQQSTWLVGWWWKNWLSLSSYTAAGTNSPNSYCFVPISSSSDWWQCQA